MKMNEATDKFSAAVKGYEAQIQERDVAISEFKEKSKASE